MQKTAAETAQTVAHWTTAQLIDAFNALDLDGAAMVSRAVKAVADQSVERTGAFCRNPPSHSHDALGLPLRSLDLISDAVWIEVLARATDLPAIDRKALDASHALPADDPRRPQLEFMRARGCIVFRRSAVSETDWVATSDPEDRFTLTLLRQMSETPPEICIASEADIEATIDRLYLRDAVDAQPEGGDDLARMLARAQEGPVVRYVNATISAAVASGASDIHFEPTANGLSVRFRIDGELTPAEPPPPGSDAAILSRVKVLASLDIAERRRPQDGRAQIEIAASAGLRAPGSIDVRVATSPSLHGESIVMRILRREAAAPTLGGLGAPSALVEDIVLLLARTTGLVFVTGPTGSGKTTTLYAMLGRLKDPRKKIITVEDPVEYEIDGLTQIQVRSEIGLDFASVLRSVVRQNPDILMVGETRDAETAKASMQAALSGHLVLSSLHTNDAASAVARLVEMGAEPYAIASTLNAVIAQRLLRRLCPHCRQPAEPAPRALAVLETAGARAAQDWSAPGCDQCRGGYVGRLAVFELLQIDESIREMVMRRASAADIRAALRARGAPSLLDEALRLVREGETSLTEVVEKIGAI